MEGFLETIRTEHLHDGLHVLVVCPGFTASNIRNTALSHDGTQQGESPRDEQKMMSAEEVAKHIASAVLSRKRDLVLTTEGKLAVWVRKFMPAFIDTQIFNKMKREKDSPLNHHNK
jgi:short-subunit dehydrogenase